VHAQLILLLRFSQSQDLGQPEEEELERDKLNYVAQGLGYLLASLKSIEHLHHRSQNQFSLMGFVPERIG
jgi:hypothetical protein